MRLDSSCVQARSCLFTGCIGRLNSSDEWPIQRIRFATLALDRDITMTQTTMSFSIEPVTQETVTVKIGKALDFRNAADFKTTCQEQVQSGARNFILDFSETGILDSTGLGSIFSLYRQVSPLNGQVVFASVSRPVQVVVQLTRTYKVFRQFPSLDSAREALP